MSDTGALVYVVDDDASAREGPQADGRGGEVPQRPLLPAERLPLDGPPPLRERRQDIGLLIRFFTQRCAKKLNRAIEEIPVNVLEALTRYDWPGNIRELQNVIERSVILSKGPELCVAMPEFQVESAPLELPGRALNISKDERDHILQALKEAGGVISGPNGAAARLGLKRTTLQSRRQKYNIARQYQ